jgi:hypothetical protein
LCGFVLICHLLKFNRKVLAERLYFQLFCAIAHEFGCHANLFWHQFTTRRLPQCRRVVGIAFLGLFGEPHARALVFGKASDSSSLKGYGSKFFIDSTTK